jgi:hypothetical protein
MRNNINIWNYRKNNNSNFALSLDTNDKNK